MHRRRFFLPAALILLAFASLPARTLYVRSPTAKLLNIPRMKSPGQPLKKGQALTQIGQQGMFYHVRANGGSGYVAKMFVSKIKPGKKVSFGSNVNKSTSVKARARASNYSQTASARGFAASKSLRTRGNIHEFDFDSVHWIENIEIDSRDVENFRGSAL